MSDPQISIIIVNYNASKMLDDCIVSIKQYSADIDKEIIVVDNNSDDTIQWVAEKHNDVIFILNQENYGFAKANNQGIAIARGKYILILNNDTLFVEKTLNEIIGFYESQSDKLFIGCKLINADGTMQNSVMSFPSFTIVLSSHFRLDKLFPNSKKINKSFLSKMDPRTPVETDVVFGAFIFCETAVIRALNGFDERFFFYSEEIDLCRRHQLNGGKVIFYPQTKVIHLGGATTNTMPFFKYKNQVTAYLQIYQKYFSGAQFVLILCIHFFSLLIKAPLFLLWGMLSFRREWIIRGCFTFLQLFIYPKNKFKNADVAVEK